MDVTYDIVYKVILIGDSGVGKTATMERYLKGHFANEYSSTIGIDFGVKIVNKDNRNIKLQMWDTAGQDKFKSLISTYFRNVNVVLLVYSIKNMQSFINLKFWYEEFKSKAVGNEIIFVIGNKLDGSHTERIVSTEDGRHYAKRIGAEFFEVSAKADIHVDTLFESIIEKVDSSQSNMTDVNIGSNNNIILKKEGANSKCCK